MPTLDDLDFSVRFANDEELRGWLRFYRPTSVADERAWLDAIPHGGELIWLMERRDGASWSPLGFISLIDHHPVHAHAELGLGILGADARGQGYGGEAIRLVLTHAFRAMALQRVHLQVFADNPALRLYERLGFRVEGTMRRHAFKRGAWRDQVLMGLLREEFSAWL